MYGRNDAVEELLKRGVAARPALQEALAAAPEARRRALQAARLLARVAGCGSLAWQVVETAPDASGAALLRQLLRETPRGGGGAPPRPRPPQPPPPPRQPAEGFRCVCSPVVTKPDL
jgi:hypothetical protein